MNFSLSHKDFYNRDALLEYTETFFKNKTVPSGKLESLLQKLGFWGLTSLQPSTSSDAINLRKVKQHFKTWNNQDIESIAPEYRWLLLQDDVLAKHESFSSDDVYSKSQFISLNHRVLPDNQNPLKNTGLEMICVGGGDEIGGSCYAYKYEDIVFLVDLGCYPDSDSKEPDLSTLPPDWIENLDSIILTHLHADHSGGLVCYHPRIEKIGRIYLERPPDVYMSPLSEKLYEPVQMLNSQSSPDRRDLIRDSVKAIKRLIQKHDGKFSIGELQITLIPTAHCPGAVAVHINTPRGSVLHAVDYSGESSYGLFETPIEQLLPLPADVIVMEATYGDLGKNITDRIRQVRLPDVLGSFVDTLENKDPLFGKYRLFPAFSLGRSQEMVSYLEKLQPGSTLIGGSARTFNREMRNVNSEWSCPENTGTAGRRNIVASSGWLEEDSFSWNEFNKLEDNEAVVFTGYLKPDTLAHELVNKGSSGPRVYSLPVSSHASFSQLAALVHISRASKVVLVHRGYKNSTSTDISRFLSEKNYQVLTPKNGELIKL